MARRKKKVSNNLNIPYEKIIWFIVALMAVMAIMRNGIAGKFLNAIGIFILGDMHIVFNCALILLAVFIIFKKKETSLFSLKLSGIITIVIIVAGLIHLNKIDVIKHNMSEEATIAYNLAIQSIKSIKIGYGGGIVGILVSFSLVSLFNKLGASIILYALLVIIAMLTTGISIYDVVMTPINKAKAKLKNNKTNNEDEVIIKKIEDTKDNKQVITNIEDLYINKYEAPKREEKIETHDVVEELDNASYKLPSYSLLSAPSKNNNKENEEAIKQTVPILTSLFNNFEIKTKVVKANIGPSVTQYELSVAPGTKLSKILNLQREIALALAAREVRIQAPIPGKTTIGIEIPNKVINTVSVREILETVPSSLNNSKLLACLGRDIMGNPHWMEINKTPHLLVAGSTGSGKSVCINSIITSLLMRSKPSEVKLVLVDPKKVELSMYNGIPHLLVPVVTDPKKANIALKNIVNEMETRYDKFEESGTKNISGYNEYIEKHNKNSDEKLKTLPYIVVIIDELADLMLVAAKEVEDSIRRITQMARAAGIHLIVATQRPSTDVITGVVKSNIPSRISFAVASQIDSRTILDQGGAEKLLGKGDMLFLPQGENMPVRIQGTFISDNDIKKVAEYTVRQQKANYDNKFLESPEEKGAITGLEDSEKPDEPMYNDVVDFVISTQRASTSLLQRQFRFGYNRAARCMDLLEERGIVGPNQGSKPREVLIKKEDNNENY